MSLKSENRSIEARKKSESRKQKSASSSVRPVLQSEAAEMETFGLQSSDFFRHLGLAPRVSDESTPLKQFNSEF